MANQSYSSANVSNLVNGTAGAGQIVCSRFVHQHEASGAVKKVKMSGNGTGGARIDAPCLGISQEYPRGTPGTPWAQQVTTSPSGTTHFLATHEADQSLLVYEEGEECFIESAAAFFSGQYLTWDIHGRGVGLGEGAGTYAYYGAQAVDAATAAGQFVRCVIKKGVMK